jgi:hypothetical protein
MRKKDGKYSRSRTHQYNLDVVYTPTKTALKFVIAYRF